MDRNEIQAQAREAANIVLSSEHLAVMTRPAAQRILLEAAQILSRETSEHALAIGLCVVAAWLEQDGNVQPALRENKELVNDEHSA